MDFRIQWVAMDAVILSVMLWCSSVVKKTLSRLLCFIANVGTDQSLGCLARSMPRAVFVISWSCLLDGLTLESCSKVKVEMHGQPRCLYSGLHTSGIPWQAWIVDNPVALGSLAPVSTCLTFLMQLYSVTGPAVLAWIQNDEIKIRRYFESAR